MPTNIEKFEAAKTLLMGRAHDAFIAEFGSIPERVWRIGGAGQKYEPQEWSAEYVSYLYQGVEDIGLWFNKRPSKEQVRSMERISGKPLEPERVCLHMRQENSSCACKISDLLEEKTWSLSRELIANRAKELCDIYIPKEGQFCCRYCGYVTDEANKIKSTIIARQYPGMRKEFDYCSSRCASHDQMAHEG